LLVVGSAYLPQKVAKGIEAAGGRVAAFVEFEPRQWGREVEGVRVVSLDDALMITGPDPIVVVGIWSPNHIYAETRAWLEAAGVRQVLPVNAAFWAYADHIGSHYQFGKPALYGERRQDCLRVYDCLADQESRNQFAGILHYRITLDPRTLPTPSYKRIYFDPSVSTLGHDAVVADIGAYSGDTLATFLYWKGTRFQRFVAIEPDPLSFQQLLAFRDSLPSGVRSRIECVHAAVADKPGTLRFTPTGKPGTTPTETGTDEVRCVTIDDTFDDKPLDFIKVDVEGAEATVLAGAWRVIERTRPTIGLSVYHAPADLFELSLQLVDRLRNYSFHLRAHDFDGIDFIFYAVPFERAPRRSRRQLRPR
jgi:FkbM family methyltransferase